MYQYLPFHTLSKKFFFMFSEISEIFKNVIINDVCAFAQLINHHFQHSVNTWKKGVNSQCILWTSVSTKLLNCFFLVSVQEYILPGIIYTFKGKDDLYSLWQSAVWCELSKPVSNNFLCKKKYISFICGLFVHIQQGFN